MKTLKFHNNQALHCTSSLIYATIDGFVSYIFCNITNWVLTSLKVNLLFLTKGQNDKIKISNNKISIYED